jgi:hypothetical protein
MKVDISEFHIKQETAENKLYTLIGNEEYLDEDGYPRSKIDNEQVMAKAIRNKLGKAMNSNLQYRFYIKTDPNKKIYDPTQIYSIDKKNKSSFLNKICKTETIFSEVTENIFSRYIEFLKTKNHKILSSTQRELK